MALPILHAAATWFMTGLIWFVQVVHYPLMGQVGRTEAAGYAAAHQRRVSLVVIPVMLLEAITAVGLLASPPDGTGRMLPGFGLAMLVFIWASTAMLIMPMHGRLLAGSDSRAHRRLVLTNWIRTLLWTARAVVASLLLRAAG
ncbi:MAG: hypothetical protein SF070_10565 [Gemmatimonadota bacterium]|nr:hypothetical protein [Gemmatimonadota bacterium]